MTQDQEGAAKAIAAAIEDQARQHDTLEIPASGQVPGVPPPQEAPQLAQDASLTNALVLVEHLVYFVSTVLRDARA